MNLDSSIPLLVIASSLLPGLIIFTLAEHMKPLRTSLNLMGALVNLALVGWMLWGVYHGHHYEARLPFLPNLQLVLLADTLSLFFLILSAGLWLVTTIYAIGYLEGSPHRSRFFGFFSLCVTATAGIALAGNLATFVLFYELLTLATYPLIMHRGTETARRAGQSYLTYTIFGGALLLVGTVWLYTLTGTLEFTPRGFLDGMDQEYRPALVAIFALLITGLGVKAALVPLHGWLPQAMVAPAPVSALLHAVAVVKAGAFGIVRVVYEVFGAEFASRLGVMDPLAIVAAATRTSSTGRWSVIGGTGRPGPTVARPTPGPEPTDWPARSSRPTSHLRSTTRFATNCESSSIVASAKAASKPTSRPVSLCLTQTDRTNPDTD